MNDQHVDKRQIAQQFIQALPHSRALGMELLGFQDRCVELTMPYNPDFIGDPLTGVIHGGAVSALMDTCCGLAVMNHESRPHTIATIDLRINYMRPATPGQAIRSRAEVYHMTRSVAFVRACALDDDEKRPVATATGTFTVGNN